MPYYGQRQQQEVTVPVAFPPLEGAPGTDDRREARLIVAIAVGSGLVLGLIGAVLFQLVLALLGGVRPAPMACQPGTCEEGLVCGPQGVCREPPARTQCMPYDTCGTAYSTCECTGQNMACSDDNLCIATTAQPTQSACENKKIQDLLTRVNEMCKGDIGRCRPEDLQKFAIASKDFDEIISLVPETITVHYAAGKPSLSDKHREYYLQRMRDLRVIDSLSTAKVILVIGRASAGGAESVNNKVSRARGQETVDLLRKLTKTADSGTYNKLSQVKLLILGNNKIIEPKFFEKSFRNRLIAWSAAMEATLLANLDNAEDLSSEDDQWTRDAINQVGIIVPIACDLPGAHK